MREWDGCYFYLDGREFAFRAWGRVPRVGEIVVFVRDDDPFLVTKVLWRETKQNRGEPTSKPYAEIEIKRDKAP